MVPLYFQSSDGVWLVDVPRPPDVDHPGVAGKSSDRTTAARRRRHLRERPRRSV